MRKGINSFTAGELSPLMEGRLDLAESLGKGCRRLKGFFPHPTGGIFRRPGLRYTGRAKYEDRAAVLIPFQRDAVTAFQLECGDGYLRVWSPDGSLSVTELPAPWTAAQVYALQWLQSNDTMFLFHAELPPQVLTRAAGIFNLAPVVWEYPPLRDANVSATTLACSVANTGETGTLVATAAVFSAGHVGSFWEVAHVRELPFVKLDTGTGSATATGLLTMTAQPSADEQVSVGGQPYKFVATPAAPYEVALGADRAASRTNLIAAINGTGGGPGTVAHPLVTAADAGDVSTAIQANRVLSSAAVPYEGTTVRVGTVTYRFAVGVPSANDVAFVGTPGSRSAADIAATLANLVKAINGTGVAGVDYGVGTAAHPDVSADAVVGLNVTVRARVAGAAGNSITLATNSILLPPYPYVYAFTWAGPSLSGGADGSISRVRVTARAAGEEGNTIVLGETCAASSWGGEFMSGGASLGLAVPFVSESLRVTGTWEVFSVGEWTGTVWLEKEVGGAWEVLRTWTSQGDYNIQTSGTVAEETSLRLRFAGTGEVSASPTFNAPNPRVQLTAVDAEVKGVVQVVAYTSPTEVTVQVVKPLFLAAGETVPAATTRWAEGAFSAVRGYPRAACFYEQRLALAGIADEPERLYFSGTADLLNFQRTGLDDAALAVDLAATESSPIVTLASMGDGLFVGTAAAEWLLRGSEGQPLSPSSVSALLKNAVGGAGLRPVVLGGTVIFAQNGAESLREFVFDWQGQNYVVPELSEAASHLPRGGIRCLAFARKPAAMLYAVTNDGRLLTCLYRRESQIIAWAEHSTEGEFEWVSVNGSGAVDQVWFIVNRNGARLVEKFDDAWFERAQTEEAAALLYADGGVTVAGTVTEVTGLDHLEGLEVGIMADGAEHLPAVVNAGRVVVNGTFSSVTVGVPYRSEVEPMPFQVQMNDGASEGRKHKAGPLAVRFYRSMACDYSDAPDASRYALNFRDGGDVVESAPPLFTGWKTMSPPARFRDSLEVTLSTSGMFPLNILAVAPAFSIYGA